MPEYVVYPLVLLIIALALYGFFRKPRPSKYQFSDEPFTLPETWHLFTPAERRFLQALDEAVGHEYRIFGKVRLEDIVGALRQQSNTFISWQSASLMHVDFVVCDKEDLSVLACIELDDKSHFYEDVKRRDAEKDRTIKAAGIPLLRFPARASYNSLEIGSQLAEAITTKLRTTKPNH